MAVETDVFVAECVRLLQHIRRYDRELQQTVAGRFGISPGQLTALRAMPAEGAITMSRLSQEVSLAPSTMTRVVDQLAAKDLARRAGDTGDRRVVSVSLTEGGQRALREATMATEQAYRDALSFVQPRERETVLVTLSQMQDALASWQALHGEE